VQPSSKTVGYDETPQNYERKERISDEQKMEALRRQHSQEEELWKEDAIRRFQVAY